MKRNSRMQGAGLLVAIAALSGCAGLTPEQRLAQASADLAARTACCDNWADAKALPLPLVSTKFVMDNTAQVYRQDGEKVYGLLLQLPAYTRTYGITVSSLTQGLQTDMLVFTPMVKMMNERFEVTRAYDEKDLRTRGKNPERTVYVNPANANERYMLIHGATLKGSFVKNMPVQSTQAIYTGYGTVYWTSGADVNATIRGSSVGEITIMVDGLTPPAK